MATFLRSVWRGYRDGLGWFLAHIVAAMSKLGRVITRRPWLTLSVSVVVFGACCAGWLAIFTEGRADRLWVPAGTESMALRDWEEANYPSSAGFAQMVGTLPEEWGGNVLRLETSWELMRLHQSVLALEVTHEGRTSTYSDLCLRRSPTEGCVTVGYLDLLGGNLSAYSAAVNGSSTDAAAGDAAALLAAANRRTFPDGSDVLALSVYGGVAMSGLNITAARAVSQTYLLDKQAPDAAVDAWYTAFLDLMEQEAPRLQYTQVSYISGSSIDDEITRSVSADFPLIAISIGVFLITAVLQLARWDSVESRAGLAITGLCLAALAMGGAYGISFVSGWPFTSLSQALPFVLLGVAVDVMFVLAEAYEALCTADPTEELSPRFGRLMGGAGLSVVITTTCSAVAFALGTLVPLPSIRGFAIQGLLAVLFICIIQLTGFIAAFVLNERRVDANRYDLLCCWRSRRSRTATLAAAGGMAVAVDAATAAAAAPKAPPPPATMHAPSLTAASPAAGSSVDGKRTAAAPTHHRGVGGVLSTFMTRYYTPWLLWWPIKALVVLIFVGFAVVSGIGISYLGSGQPVQQTVPDSSYLIPYFNIQDATYNQQLGVTTRAYFRALDPAPPAHQASMLSAANATLSNPNINATLSALRGNWLVEFSYWVQLTGRAQMDASGGCVNVYAGNARVNDSGTPFVALLPEGLPPLEGCVPEAQFYDLLRDWLSLPEHRSKASIFLWNEDGRIRSSFFEFVQIAQGNVTTSTGPLWRSVSGLSDEMNAELFPAQSAAAGEPVFFLHEGNYIFAQGDSLLPSLCGEYAALAVAGVGVVLLITLVHPLAALLLMLAVALVLLYIFGAMWIGGIRFNQVSVVNLVVATGLAVDYSVYPAQKFMATPGPSRNARMEVVLAEYGAAILMGAVTALLGTIPLAFASSVILRTFFALLFSTIVFSAAVGLVLVPVLFSLVGPDALEQLTTAARGSASLPSHSLGPRAGAAAPPPRGEEEGEGERTVKGSLVGDTRPAAPSEGVQDV